MDEKLDTHTTTTQLDNLLTGGDVARILKISRSYAYRLMRRGEMPVVRLGRSVRVRPIDLDQFIKASLTWGR